MSLDLNDFIGNIKGLDKILSKIDFPDFNIIIAYYHVCIQR